MIKQEKIKNLIEDLEDLIEEIELRIETIDKTIKVFPNEIKFYILQSEMDTLRSVNLRLMDILLSE